MASVMNAGLPTFFSRELSGPCVFSRQDLHRKRRMANCLIRLGMTVETAGEQGGRQDRQLALAWTPISGVTSVIVMPLKLCSFICKVRT